MVYVLVKPVRYLLQLRREENPMTEASDLIKLYSSRILALAADIPHQGRLVGPDMSVKRRSPLCGSTVTIDLCLTDGKITDFAQDVKACALGQASAAILGQFIIGRTLDEIKNARDELLAMLKTNGPVPAPPFSGFEVLLPAREYKNRHASIMLAVEATAEAMTNLGA
jgi:NifU-like protein involved in Fe-S cluster formation